MKTTPLPSVEEVKVQGWEILKKIETVQVYGLYKILQREITQDRNQAYTSLVEGIKAQVKDINGEGSVFDDFATDILENVVKPLYGKEIDMNNPKVGDVKIIKPSIDSSQDTLNELLLTLVDAVNELNGHTPVKPEKTLEEKFEEYRNDEEGIDCAYRCIVDLAQIAEEHYKDKQD